MALGGLVLGSLILYLKGMRTTMFQLSGFYCIVFCHIGDLVRAPAAALLVLFLLLLPGLALAVAPAFVPEPFLKSDAEVQGRE